AVAVGPRCAVPARQPHARRACRRSGNRSVRGSRYRVLDRIAEDLGMAQSTIRSRSLWVLNNTLNRVTSRIARSGHGPFSLIRHVGRKSGRTYETPVILAASPHGFIAELTYGENVNWYGNVVAAGECVVLHHRREYRVTSVEPCSAELGRSAYPVPFRFILKALDRNEFRLLRTGPQSAASVASDV